MSTPPKAALTAADDVQPAVLDWLNNRDVAWAAIHSGTAQQSAHAEGHG
ncbi:hypothetical protein [Streptomyces sp. NPDC046332]